MTEYQNLGGWWNDRTDDPGGGRGYGKGGGRKDDGRSAVQASPVQ